MGQGCFPSEKQKDEAVQDRGPGYHPPTDTSCAHSPPCRARTEPPAPTLTKPLCLASLVGWVGLGWLFANLAASQAGPSEGSQAAEPAC